jgi:hypothetical protein
VVFNSWGGAGLLGVTIRLDNYAGAEDRFIRVLSVDTENGNSPASVAGLSADGTDFILGTTHHTINSLSHFAQLLNENVDRVIELYVYNSSTDVVRVVTLLPSYEWNKNGGKGLLGAEVGTGYLHRLPYKSRSTSGSCIERKVRYIPTANKEHNVVLVEDAPQMEMEPPEFDDDDNSDHVEEVYSEPKRASIPVDPAHEDKNLTEASDTHSVAEQEEQPPTEIPSDLTTESIPPDSSVLQESEPAPLLRSVPEQSRPFEQPFAPPPFIANRGPPSQPRGVANALSPLGAPPLPPQMGPSNATTAVNSTVSSHSSNVTPQALSYQHPPLPAVGQVSYSHGGGPAAMGTSGSYGSSYSVPPTYSYASTMPPPPVGYRPYSSQQ